MILRTYSSKMRKHLGDMPARKKKVCDCIRKAYHERGDVRVGRS